jgi:hypothetical protein
MHSNVGVHVATELGVSTHETSLALTATAHVNQYRTSDYISRSRIGTAHSLSLFIVQDQVSLNRL